MQEWSNENSDRASAQGWNIFEASGSVFNAKERRKFQLQKVDEAEEFDSDMEAWDFVVQRAWSEEPLHLKALNFLKERSPDEYRDAINFTHGCIEDRQTEVPIDAETRWVVK